MVIWLREAVAVAVLSSAMVSITVRNKVLKIEAKN